MVEFGKLQNIGPADLIHDIKAYFGFMMKQIKIIPFWWLFFSLSELTLFFPKT